jgi:hypothetical protein
VTGLEQPSLSRPGRHRRRRRRGLRVLAFVVTAAVVFVLGVAVGMALRDDPEPGGTVTIVRTLEPLPQQPGTTR